MPMPDWYQDAKKQMEAAQIVDDKPVTASFRPVELERVSDLAHVFAEYSLKENDILIHLFARGGLSDVWTPGHYINKCSKCGSVVDAQEGPAMKACACGHFGLVYVPGRTEEKNKVSFKQGVEAIIEGAVETAWLGSTALEHIPELDAFVLQLQGARTVANTVGVEKFVRKICENINKHLGE